MNILNIVTIDPTMPKYLLLKRCAPMLFLSMILDKNVAWFRSATIRAAVHWKQFGSIYAIETYI